MRRFLRDQSALQLDGILFSKAMRPRIASSLFKVKSVQLYTSPADALWLVVVVTRSTTPTTWFQLGKEAQHGTTATLSVRMDKSRRSSTQLESACVPLPPR
jgi:hypothetical protein